MAVSLVVIYIAQLGVCLSAVSGCRWSLFLALFFVNLVVSIAHVFSPATGMAADILNWPKSGGGVVYMMHLNSARRNRPGVAAGHPVLWRPAICMARGDPAISDPGAR